MWKKFLNNRSVSPLELVNAPHNQNHSVLISMGLSFTLMALVLYFARQAGVRGTEFDLTVRSTWLALIAVSPVILQSLLTNRSRVERITMLMWWVLKLGFMFYYYFYIWEALNHPRLYLSFSDHMAFHEWAGRVSDYWSRSGLKLIPKHEFYLMSIGYPAVAYFFGGLYYFLGRFPGVVLPWLTVLQFISAVVAQRVLEIADLKPRYAKAAFHLLLWSPFMWAITLLVHRDILIILALLIISAGILQLIKGKILAGMLGSIAATLLLANLRAEMLYLVLVVFFISLLSVFKYGVSGTTGKTAALSMCFILIALIFWMIFGEGQELYIAKFNIGTKIYSVASKYLEPKSSSGIFYGFIVPLGGFFIVPLVIPFKLLVGVTAPFPWRFTSYQLMVTQPFYSLESILRISLIIMAARTLLSRTGRKEVLSGRSTLLVITGGIFALGGMLGPQNEVRYLAPAIPLCAPIFAQQATSAMVWIKTILLSCFLIACLHAAYAILGGTL